MIATVTANPCIDKTLLCDGLDLYKMNRAELLRTDPAGKGINVSYALSNLGEKTLVLGFDFTNGNSVLKNALAAKKISHDLVDIRGELRTCIKIFDKSINHTVEINEYGASISKADEDALLNKILERVGKCDILTLSGSLPRGASCDFYFRCIKEIKKAAPGCKICLDAQGEPLRLGLSASPYFIKPNIYEFKEAFGLEDDGLYSLDKRAREVVKSYGLGFICVSLGKDGAYISSGEESYFCKAPKVTVRSIQGAGDSMVAGMCVSLMRGLPLSEILKYGVASASASIAIEGTQFATLSDFERVLMGGLEVNKIF